MILNYLLAFSILVTSVIKVTDLFIHADKDLKAKRTEFIKETQKTHDRGSISLTAALFTLMLSSLLLFFVIKFKVELNEARYRKDSYLCFEYLNITTENYIKDMTKLNWSLRTAFAAQVLGGATTAAFEALKVARDLRHAYYMTNLVKNSYCKSTVSTFAYLKNLPYETKGVFFLQTLPDGTTLFRKNKWNNIFYQPANGIRRKNSFCLKAEMSADGPFLPNFKIKTSEISMVGFSKLKCLSGFL